MITTVPAVVQEDPQMAHPSPSWTVAPHPEPEVEEPCNQEIQILKATQSCLS